MGQGFHHRTIDLAELADELQALARAAKEHAAAAGTNDPEDAAPFKDMLQGVGGLYNTLDATETEKRCAAAWRKQQPLGADQAPSTATKTFTKMFSDISGKDIQGNGGTVEFSFAGKSYSIDLTNSERAEFERAIGKYIDAASGQGRPVTKKTTARKSARKKASPRKSAQRKSSDTDAKAVRAWAVENGIEVPQRGRIPGAVIAQFEEANSGKQS